MHLIGFAIEVCKFLPLNIFPWVFLFLEISLLKFGTTIFPFVPIPLVVVFTFNDYLLLLPLILVWLMPLLSWGWCLTLCWTDVSTLSLVNLGFLLKVLQASSCTLAKILYLKSSNCIKAFFSSSIGGLHFVNNFTIHSHVPMGLLASHCTCLPISCHQNPIASFKDD